MRLRNGRLPVLSNYSSIARCAPLWFDKYQDDIDDRQRGLRRKFVEPPRIPQTLTSFNLRVHLWSPLDDFDAPAQNRACPIRALGSHLGCLTRWHMAATP